MAVINLYKHNARSYYDVYNPLTTAYPRKPTWMFKEMAGMFDHQSELMNRIATDILYPSTRESAYAFANLCDYSPAEADGATDTITFTLSSAMTKTIAAGYQVGGISASTGMMVVYETTASGSSGGTSSITVAAKQKKTYTSIPVFTIDNSDDFADYPIDGYTNIIASTCVLVIDGDTWTKVNYFDDSLSTDKHYRLIYQSSGKVRIGFGDGTTGLKPTIGMMAYLTFAVTQGLAGRMDAGTLTYNIGQDSQITAVTNAGSSGGSDSESVTAIIKNSRANVRLRDVVWTTEDIENAARTYSSSVQKAYAEGSLGSATVQVIISGGADPSSILSALSAYITSKTQFGVLPVSALVPNEVPVNISASITVRTGFTAATVRDLVEFALTMATCSFDNQVIEYYTDNGIDSCRTNLINVIWAWAFTEDENEALEFIILKWIALLGSRDSREWGQPLEVGDLWIMANSLYAYGCDTFSLTSPTVNVTTDDDEIISTGTITIA
jgi:hypothetical protein